MRNSLAVFAFFVVIQGFFRCQRRCKIKWRKLFLAGTMITAFGIMLRTPTIPSLQLSFRQKPNVSAKSLSSYRIARQTRMQRLYSFTTHPIIPLYSLAADRIPREGRKFKKRKKRKMNDELVIKDPPLPAPRILTATERRVMSLPPAKALVYAKGEIERAPPVTDNLELHSPIFRNISAFKRSYELMELILKVFIYRDGRKPIFHEPHLRGIYASEGWFMKLIEHNRQFITRDPKKAHLFYLPYSVKQLQKALYVPNSHDIKPLSIFLRDYVNMIAANYPFWNRTHGSDHFFVACHDWGPFTVTEHPELRSGAIKALCNADSSDGIFDPGKDVSLPEITIRTPSRPLRYIGNGKRVSQRQILAFFAGRLHGRVRPKILYHWRKDEHMKIYSSLPRSVARNMTYIQHMKSSKFCLCPMGYEVNSPRIVEAIYYECVPVIIADNFVLPFSDVLDWRSFSIVVKEKDIPKLKEILLAIPLRRYLKMQMNVKMVQRHFLWSNTPRRYDVFHMILHSIWNKRLRQVRIRGSDQIASY